MDISTNTIKYIVWINCYFLTKEINVEKAANYILNEFNYKSSNKVIYKTYIQMRNKI